MPIRNAFWRLPNEYIAQRGPQLEPSKGGRRHATPHKQTYLDIFAWPKERDRRIAKEAERKWITFLTNVKANHSGGSFAVAAPQIPATAVAIHLLVLVCTQAVRQPPNVFIYSEPLGEITVSCCPFFPSCPDGICVNNISLVRQKISTGEHSGGD